MKHEFRLADIGEGLEEAEIIAWRVAVGDVVNRDQALVEIMTDKSNAELPAPTSGTILELGGSAGDMLAVGEVLAVIDDGLAPDSGPLPGPSAETAPAVEPASPIGAATRAQASSPSEPDSARVKASPATRREAARRGVDLTTIAGTGPGGRILLGDLEAAAPSAEPDSGSPAPSPEQDPEAAQPEAPQPEAPQPEAAQPEAAQPEAAQPESAQPEAAQPESAQSEAAQPLPEPHVPTSVQSESPAAPVRLPRVDQPAPPVAPTGQPVGTSPLRGVRRAIAQNMTRSWTEIPHIHAFEHIDAEPMLELRAELKATERPEFERLTPLTFFVAAVASALRAHPQANASIDMQNETITHHARVNVGVAVAAPRGLVVPVLHGAETLDFSTTAVTLAALVDGARSGTMAREHFMRGTVTITNFGSLGGEQATPLIRPPESLIVGFGSVAERPFVIDGDLVARKTMHLVAGADHRLLDGDVTTSVLTHIARSLMRPVTLLVGP